MKTLIAITLFVGMFLGLSGAPAGSAFSSNSRRSPAVPAASSRDAGVKVTDAAATINAAEQSRATEILSDLKRQYRDLDGVTVRMGTTPNREQAVAYYTLNEIVISPAHTATLKEILAHEVWHVIDYRDNGRLDWGENLPPANSARYAKS